MQISDKETRKVLEILERVHREQPEPGFVPEPSDAELIRQVTANVMAMPDRDDRVAALKAAIERGEYSVSGHEIVEAMIRRAIADGVR
jgi:hypothetical protein